MRTAIDDAVNDALASKRVVGAVVVVVERGETVHRRAYGLADREAGRAMTVETPFRFASLTKPIAAMTAMALVARGAIDLDAPVTRYLPDFRPRLADGSTPEILIRHLMTHTSGLSYSFFEPGAKGPYHDAGISDGLDQPGLSMAENMRRLASVALKSAPGTKWGYSLSMDVIGAVIEEVTGSFAAAVAEYVTTPLGLREIAFHPPRPSDLAIPYYDGKPEPIRMNDERQDVPVRDAKCTFSPARALNPDSYPSGGAGLVGTADDFVRFLEAWRTRSPLLPPKATQDAMTTNQIGITPDQGLEPGWKFGFGASVLVDPKASDTPLAAGSYTWGGAYGHAWWVDPTAQKTILLMTNTTFEGMRGQLTKDVLKAAFV